jgi:nitrilase
MKYAAVQMCSGLDVAANVDTACRLLAEAAAGGAVLAVLPENFALMAQKERDKRAIAETDGDGPVQNRLAACARAVENLCALVASAQAGTHQNGRQTYGHSAVIDCWGRVLAELPAGEGVAVGEVDFDRQARVRSEFPALEHRVLGRTIS